GTRVECLHRSPAGDPIAFLIRGAMIALRREDAVGVLVSLT
ncbi:MAG: FeoA family protein, partial [Oscillospiraceae bacterium]